MPATARLPGTRRAPAPASLLAAAMRSNSRNKQQWDFPLPCTHTHQSTRVSAASTRRHKVGRRALGSASACACRRAAPSLGAGVHTARPPRRARASAGRRLARHEGRLASTRVSAHTARLRRAASRAKFTSVCQRQVAGVRWSLALGCTRAQPTHLRPLHNNTMARRPTTEARGTTRARRLARRRVAG
jgi:hypothetical protein